MGASPDRVRRLYYYDHKLSATTSVTGGWAFHLCNNKHIRICEHSNPCSACALACFWHTMLLDCKFLSRHCLITVPSPRATGFHSALACERWLSTSHSSSRMSTDSVRVVRCIEKAAGFVERGARVAPSATAPSLTMKSGSDTPAGAPSAGGGSLTMTSRSSRRSSWGAVSVRWAHAQHAAVSGIWGCGVQSASTPHGHRQTSDANPIEPVGNRRDVHHGKTELYPYSTHLFWREGGP